MLFPPTPQTDPRLENLIPAPIRPTTTSTLFNITRHHCPIAKHVRCWPSQIPTFSPAALFARRLHAAVGRALVERTRHRLAHTSLSRARTARHGTARQAPEPCSGCRRGQGKEHEHAPPYGTARTFREHPRFSSAGVERPPKPKNFQACRAEIASARREGGGKPLSSPFLSLGVRRRAGGRRVEDWKRTTWPRGCGGVPRPQACWEHRPAGRPRFLFFFFLLFGLFSERQLELRK